MNTLHVQAKHEIKYSDIEAFRNASYEIDCIINDLCDDFWSNGDEWGSTPTEYEIGRDSFKQMIETLKDMTDEGFNDVYSIENYNRLDVIKTFESMLEGSDPNNEYIYLSWF